MKAVLRALLPAALALGACNKPGTSGAVGGPLKSQKDKVSYGIGLDIGRNFKQQNMDIDVDLLRRGILDVQTGAKPALSDSEMQAAMSQFQQEMMAKQQEAGVKKGEDNKKAGEEFLARNAKAEGVKVTASGLQYKVLAPGKGKVSPKASDQVTVHYVGTLLDGTEFDSSVRRGQPATFPVGGVIRGWTEALQLMHEGDKFKLFIPSDLAYGERGAGQQIGPHAMLTFEVELISIQSGNAAPAKP